jgi:hypothetical protein
LSFLDGNFWNFPSSDFFQFEALIFFQSHPMAMHILFFTTALKCLKTLRPGGIRTRDLLFWKRTR